MNTEALDLEELCVKAQAATPGPWEVKPYTGDSQPEYVGPIAGEEIISATGGSVIGQLGCGCCDLGLQGTPEDAAHIAAFDPPTVLALIERARAIGRVEALHHPDAVRPEFCAECSDFGTDDYPPGSCVEWPCPTIRALRGDPE